MSGTVCKFFETAKGCSNGSKCPYMHIVSSANQVSLIGVFGTEVIDVPSTDSMLMIGKKGSVIKHLRTTYGNASVDIPEFSKERKTYPVTIKADLGIVQAIIVKMTNILLSGKRDINYMIPFLKKYELFPFIQYLETNGLIKRQLDDVVERPSKRPTLLPIEDSFNSNTHYVQFDKSGPSNGHSNIPPLMDNFQPGTSLMTGTLTSGWGAMVDEQNIDMDIIKSDATLDLLKEGTKSGIIPNKREFLYLSQHVVTDSYSPMGSSSHPNSIKTKPQEIVTFVQGCECSNNCGFALFSMDLKEKDYLTHLVLIHFWRRISSFLDEGLPFTCPIKDCAKQFLNFKTLVLHYGGIPHKKVGALILDSVGERVKNVRGESVSSREELEKAKRYIEDLKQRLANMELNKQEEANNKNLSTVETKLASALKDAADYKKKEEKLANEKKTLEENFKKKESALKNSTDSLTSNLKKLNDLKSDLSKKDDEINSLKREISRSKSSYSGGSSASKKELESLRDEVARLKKQLKEKDEYIAKLESSGGASSVGNSALIEKLKKTVKSQKNMLELKQKEIELIKEGMEDNDDDIINLD